MAILGLPSTGGTLLGFLGLWDWRLDLFTHFRWQYLIMLAVTTGLAALGRHWKTVVLFAVPLLVNLSLMVPLFLSPARPAITPDSAARPLHLLQFNIHAGNHDYRPILDYLRDSDADLIFLQELTGPWHDAVLAANLPYRIAAVESRGDSFGIAFLVRQPMRNDLEIRDQRIIQMAEVPAIEIMAQWQSRELALLSLHTLPPLNARYATDRNAQLAYADAWTHSVGQPAVIIGDLNITPWSPIFRQMLHPHLLANSQRGYGIQGTWPSDGGLIGKLPIDHCLHHSQLVTVARIVGPSLGSDHRPLHVKLAWRQPSR